MTPVVIGYLSSSKGFRDWFPLLLLIAAISLTACSAANLHPVSKDPSRPTSSIRWIRADRHTKIVIFVHGIFGDAETTWRSNHGSKSWPEILKEDREFADYDIYSVAYDTTYISRTSTIEEISIALLQQLTDAGIFDNYTEINLITHSMGGLIAKRILIDLHRPSQVENLRKVKSVLFISTPARGAPLASLAAWLSSNPQLKDLQPLDVNGFLQTLDNQWQNLLRDRDGKMPFPKSYCAYETKAVAGQVLVSRLYSEDRCDKPPYGVPRTHTDIVKPSGPEDYMYVWARSRIQEASLLGSQPTVTSQRRLPKRSNENVSKLSPVDRALIVAQIDGVQKIAERLGGVFIDAETTVRSTVLVKQEIISKVAKGFGDHLMVHSIIRVRNQILLSSVTALAYFDEQTEAPRIVSVDVQGLQLAQITGPFSVASFQIALQRAGFAISGPHVHEQLLRVTVTYRDPQTTRVLAAEGHGVVFTDR